MRRAYLFGGMMACTLAALWSCGLDDSAVVAIDGDDAATADASLVDGSTDAPTDSSPGDTGVTDSGVPDTGPCPTADLPTCDTTACASTEVCAPPVSAGWTVVNLISGSRPACTAGYAPRDVVEVADGGPSSCECNCDAGAAPSCETDRLFIGNGATCGSGSSGDLSGSCATFGASVAVATNFEATFEPRIGSCVGVGATSFPDPDGGLSRACALQDDAGAAALCEGHRSCVPKPTTGRICVAHASPAACPSGFTQQNVSDSFADTRSCTACTCGWNGNGCTAPTVTGYGTSASCVTGVGDTTISTSACAPVAAVGFLSFGVTGTDTAATCGVTDAGALDGGVAVTNSEVVCCAN